MLSYRLLKPIAGILQKLKTLDGTYKYRKAFSDKEEQKIEKLFNAGKKKRGCLGPEVYATINGLPVLITHVKNTYGITWEKEDYEGLLDYLERGHQLVRWTSTYGIVTFPHRVLSTAFCPRRKKKGYSFCCVM